MSVPLQLLAVKFFNTEDYMLMDDFNVQIVQRKRITPDCPHSFNSNQQETFFYQIPSPLSNLQLILLVFYCCAPKADR